MAPTLRLFLAATLLCAWLAGCTSSSFEPPDVQGASMVADGDEPRFWVLTKREERRQVSVGGSRRSTGTWRTDTYYHFEVQAFDPATARPLWKQRLMTLGDPDAVNRYQLQTRVIGSSVGAKLLGQDGDHVWLLIGDEPFAVRTSDGALVADPDSLQASNPELKDLLPSEARHYGFDRGLVVRAADARQWVVRGPAMRVADYVPTPQPPAYPDGRLKANGSRSMVPMYPLGEIPVRHVVLDGRWIGLYSDAEAADAVDDTWGDNLLYPYSITDEGALARRTFRRATVVEDRQFDDRFERLSALTPIPDAPTFLKGRFVKDPATPMPGQALVLDDPAGVLVWHSTRMDDEGRLALARLDTSLRTVWKTELPLSETGTINVVDHWLIPGHLVAFGQLQSEVDTITGREPYVVSVALDDGALHAWSLERETAPE